MSKSCKGLLKQLFECLDKSDCVQKQGKSVVQCARSESGVPDECMSLRYAFTHCKKGMLDMRTRIRGNKGH